MIRFGIAGFGLHAVRRLMPGFALAQNCKVIALSRRDPQKAREAAAQYGILNVFGSTEELCRCHEVDAVLVTTPNACHLADVLTAVGLGKAVLCEKPMGVDAEECRQMVESARKAGVLLGVAQVFRFEESTRRLRERKAALCPGGVLILGDQPWAYLDQRSLHRRWRADRRRRRALH